jgi:uncharacterized coiled-coil protein SlyX
VPRWLIGGLAIVAAILGAAGASWLAARARYGPALAEKEAMVRELDDLVRQRNDVIRDQQKKLSALSKLLQNRESGSENPEQAIAKLKGDLQSAAKDATAAPRDPNALYQGGKIVGIVRGANADAQHRQVTFSAITAPGEIALPGTFEFMQWKLSCADSGLRATTTLGQRHELNYYRIECKIL